MPRVVVLIVVVVMHVGLVMVFSSSRRMHQKTEHDEQTMTVVLLPETLSASQSNPAPEATRRPRRSPTRAATHPELSTQTPSDSTAITASEVEARHPPAIDWAEEAKLAASRQIDSLARSRNRGAGIAAPGINLEAPPRPKPEFGWSHAQTHRIEPLPEGGTLIWINERCALVLNGGLLPVCKLGKIEARGDLFEHMHDVPDPGDWKQPP
jgi:hypothetical protein